MKRTLLFAAVCAIAFLGCSKSNTTSSQNTTNTNPSSYTMSGTLNGVAFSRDSCTYSLSSDTTKIEIVGWDGYIPSSSLYYPQIYINVGGYHGTGTYTLTDPSTTSYAQIWKSDTSKWYSKSGTLTITATSPNLVGTFSFTTSIGDVISGGSFVALRY